MCVCWEQVWIYSIWNVILKYQNNYSQTKLKLALGTSVHMGDNYFAFACLYTEENHRQRVLQELLISSCVTLCIFRKY